jgi:NDP-sugar pyrophosphorylase family protein
MLLCAGFGQRLRPLSDELPKPLMPVGDRSVLEHIARHLVQHGQTRAVANSHWLPEALNAAAARLPLPVTVVHEPVIRGVAGGIAGARELLEAPIIAWNGDILIERPPLLELFADVQRTGGVCLAVAETTGAGTVGLDEHGLVVRTRGETHGHEVRRADYVGLVGIGPDALAELPSDGCLIGDYCLPRMRRGLPVYTRFIEGSWDEVGSVESYLRANLGWLGAHHNREGASFLAPDARLSHGVQLERSVVGAGARVAGEGVISECVIWPNTTAVAPLTRAIVTPTQIVQLAPRSQ